jgi:hypothetical protein
MGGREKSPGYRGGSIGWSFGGVLAENPAGLCLSLKAIVKLYSIKVCVFMDRSLNFFKFSLGFIVIISISLSKYFNSLFIFLPTIFLISIFYQMESNKQNNAVFNFEETLINLSKFIIYCVIFGYVLARIIGLFVAGFS